MSTPTGSSPTVAMISTEWQNTGWFSQQKLKIEVTGTEIKIHTLSKTLFDRIYSFFSGKESFDQQDENVSVDLRAGASLPSDMLDSIERNVVRDFVSPGRSITVMKNLIKTNAASQIVREIEQQINRTQRASQRTLTQPPSQAASLPTPLSAPAAAPAARQDDSSLPSSDGSGQEPPQPEQPPLPDTPANASPISNGSGQAPAPALSAQFALPEAPVNVNSSALVFEPPVVSEPPVSPPADANAVTPPPVVRQEPAPVPNVGTGPVSTPAAPPAPLPAATPPPAPAPVARPVRVPSRPAAQESGTTTYSGLILKALAASFFAIPLLFRGSFLGSNTSGSRDLVPSGMPPTPAPFFPTTPLHLHQFTAVRDAFQLPVSSIFEAPESPSGSGSLLHDVTLLSPSQTSTTSVVTSPPPPTPPAPTEPPVTKPSAAATTSTAAPVAVPPSTAELEARDLSGLQKSEVIQYMNYAIERNSYEMFSKIAKYLEDKGEYGEAVIWHGKAALRNPSEYQSQFIQEIENNPFVTDNNTKLTTMVHRDLKDANEYKKEFRLLAEKFVRAGDLERAIKLFHACLEQYPGTLPNGKAFELGHSYDKYLSNQKGDQSRDEYIPNKNRFMKLVLEGIAKIYNEGTVFSEKQSMFGWTVADPDPAMAETLLSFARQIPRGGVR